VRGEIGQDVSTRREGATDTFKSARVQDGCHDVPRQRHRHIYPASRDNGGPVLVAEGMPDVDAVRQGEFGWLAKQLAKVDDQDLSEIDTDDQGESAAFVPAHDVSIEKHCAALKRDRHLRPAVGPLS
jgi:hypothetical protein